MLNRLAEKHGRKIGKVDVYGHGLPARAVDVDLDRQNLALEAGMQWNLHQGKTGMADRTFEEKVLIRFNSCFMGSGLDGDAAVQHLGTLIAGKKRDVTIFTSRVQIYPNATELLAGHTGLPLPEVVRDAGDIITRPVIAPLTFEGALRINSHFPATDLPLVIQRTRQTRVSPKFSALRSEIYQWNTDLKLDADKVRDRWTESVMAQLNETGTELRQLLDERIPLISRRGFVSNVGNHRRTRIFLHDSKDVAGREKARKYLERIHKQFGAKVDLEELEFDNAPFADIATKETQASAEVQQLRSTIEKMAKRLASEEVRIKRDLKELKLTQKQADDERTELNDLRSLSVEMAMPILRSNWYQH